MRHDILHLKDFYDFLGADGADPVLEIYLPYNMPEMGRENQKRPCMVICPGGAYRFCSEREAEAVALHFLPEGYNVFVLNYSTAPHRYPTQVREVAAAMELIHSHADQWNCDPKNIALMGFSAGGHLAASYGVFWNRKDIFQTIGDAKELKPAGLLLCYPVITSGELSHQESMHNLLGDRYDLLKEQMSLDKQVSKDTPPTFLWHTATDNSVPVENSILFFMALKQAGVPVEMHIYPCGEHGLALANFETSNKDGFGIQKECESWITLACDWMEQFR